MDAWKVTKFVAVAAVVLGFLASMIFLAVYVSRETEGGGGYEDEYSSAESSPTIRGECEDQGKFRTWEGGYGQVRMRKEDADKIRDAMDAKGSRTMKITDAESTRVDQENPYTGRGAAIYEIAEGRPVLELIEARQERSNDDFVTLRFGNGDVYFPPSMFIYVCV